jgi:hypothetical protein
MRQATSFWIEDPGSGSLRTEDLAAPASGEVLVRTLYTGISRGTESLVYRGEVPEAERDRMRAPFQAGDFPAPVKYGYLNIGVVESGARELDGGAMIYHEVLISGRDGKDWTAIYQVARQPDGSYKINGVQIVPNTDSKGI